MRRAPDDCYPILVCAEHRDALMERDEWDDEERILSAEEEAEEAEYAA